MNTTPAALIAARDLLAAWAPQPETSAANTMNSMNVDVPASGLVSAVLCLTQHHWGYLSAITGLDLGPEQAALEVLYHFCAGPAILTLRVRISRNEPEIPSLCSLLPSASVFERELGEMFGINVAGTPDTSLLYLPDDWPSEVFPMRKDAKLPPAEPV